MTKEEKEIVVLKDVYGYKLREISKMKDRNISTIKSMIEQSPKELKQLKIHIQQPI